MRQAAPSQRIGTEPIERFRPSREGWAMVVMSGLLAFILVAIATWLMMSPLSPGESHSTRLGAVLLGYGLGGLMAMIAVIFAWRLLTSEIQVSEQILSWHTQRGMQSVPWTEIPDYYETEQSDVATGDGKLKRRALEATFKYARVCVVKTPIGDCRFGQTWQNADRLQKIIAERAVNARAEQWGMLGARPALDWPNTFRYDNKTFRWFLPTLRIVCYLLIVHEIVMPGWAGLLSGFSLGWGWGVGTILIRSINPLMLFGFMSISIPTFGEMRRQRTQSITLTETGVIYQDDKRFVEAKWSKITRLTTTLRKHVIETQHGTFDFTLFISHFRVLKSGIETMTCDTIPAGWQSQINDRLDKDASLTTPSDAARFYSYRTRTNRAMLFLYLLLSGFMTGSIGWAFLTKSIHGGLTSIITFSVVEALGLGGLLFTLWGWACYFTSGIRTDADGITQIAAFGSKRILWANIRTVKGTGEDVSSGVLLSDGRQSVRLSLLIADSKELLAEIKNHTDEKMDNVGMIS